MKLIFFVLLALNLMALALYQWGGAARTGETMKGHESFQAEKVKLISEAEWKALKAAEPKIPELPPVVATAPAEEKVQTPAEVAPPAVKVRKPEKPVPPPVALLRCAEWSGIAPNDMGRAKAALHYLKLWEKASVRKMDKASGFWVFVPPRKSSAETQKKVEELKRLGVTDIFVQPENSPLKYAISLGVFSTEEAASKYLAILREKGVKSAEVGARRRETDASVITFKHLEPPMLAEVAKLQREYSGSEFRTMECR